ncbi:uncharacterized protein PpBr36_06554 [Pyricularia pennisetigena]|uniref:uncharacterized protein n=1 Tax=Pyricularia pennisetigena TaxID=1578925 RepID=UPI0011511FFC|nr:uncharacterized protein PpBr36_06554 [Pyricularia pennisetigena]TLS23318.1 hypothetical protein PpBr36_06554 [Pyricularia pennisetigena]
MFFFSPTPPWPCGICSRVSRCGTLNRLPPHRHHHFQLKYRARCINSGQVAHGCRHWL